MSSPINSPARPADNEPAATEAFAFGKNWERFLSQLDDRRIESAIDSLTELLSIDDLRERSFLDAGSGSGLFSLAARRLGAQVTSFDVDSDSVACTRSLQSHLGETTDGWQIHSGSLLDDHFMSELGDFDVVYCWGVAHHTGDMWTAIANLASCVKPGGLLVLAIYNDQLYISRGWRGVKRAYQRLPRCLRPMLVLAVAAFGFGKRLAITLAASLLRLLSLRNPLVPIVNWIRESKRRGMHDWYDLVDWVGGWPFEVARPEEVFRYLRDRGFRLEELTTADGHGCNEFVFVRSSR